MSLPSLVVGKTSQLSNYFPEDYIRVSSRHDLMAYTTTTWDTVYLCFGENRTYMAHSESKEIQDVFYSVNHRNTVDIVQMFVPCCKRVVVYSTAELWNDCIGPVGTNTPYQYRTNHYIQSKYNMTLELKNKDKYPTVSIAYPFNFNGIYRQGNFLFGKVFSSILKKKPIQLGDTYYYRDIIHPKCVAIESMVDRGGVDFMIGSGRLVHVNDLIRSLYDSFSMSYNEMVSEEILEPAIYRNRLFYSDTPANNSSKQSLLATLIEEIRKFKNDN